MRLSLVPNFQLPNVVQPGEDSFHYPLVGLVGQLSLARGWSFLPCRSDIQGLIDCRGKLFRKVRESQLRRATSSLGRLRGGPFTGSGNWCCVRCHQGSQGDSLVGREQHVFGALIFLR